MRSLTYRSSQLNKGKGDEEVTHATQRNGFSNAI